MERLDGPGGLPLALGLRVRSLLQLRKLSGYKDSLKLQKPDRKAAVVLACSAKWLQAIWSGIRTNATQYKASRKALSLALAELVAEEDVVWLRLVAEWLDEIAMHDYKRDSLDKLLQDVGPAPTSDRLDQWFSENPTHRCQLLQDLLQRLKEHGLIVEVQAMAESFAEEALLRCRQCDPEQQVEQNHQEIVNRYLRRFLEFLVTFHPGPDRCKHKRARPYRRLAQSMLKYLLKPQEEQDERKG